MEEWKMATFALGFGNRSFFPRHYMAQAREELPRVLTALGHKTIIMDEAATSRGAVQTRDEGRKWAAWLESIRGQYDGIIWTHPNFGDESGMFPALRDAGRRGDKILLHGYPDEMDKMGPDARRDSFCGLMSSMDVLRQYKIPFIKLAPHVVAPSSSRFAENIDLFAKICRNEAVDPYKPLAPESTTSGKNVLDGITLLALGARTTPFFTCRYDELTAAEHGITIETADLSKVFDTMMKISKDDAAYRARAEELRAYTNWGRASPEAFDKQVRFAVTMDRYIEEYQPAAIGVRCWTEFQEIMKISPCATISYLNHGRKDGKRIPTACEVDLGNAVTMYLMTQFSNGPVACQDWNNNYGEEDNKFMFMHCGPHDTDWLTAGSHYVATHGILDHDFGKGNGMGCIQGRFAPTPVTIGSCTIGNGKLIFYVTEGRVTEDAIPADYFGSAGVAEVPGLQQALIQIGHLGFKHHFSMTKDHVADQVIAALQQHPGFEVYDLRKVGNN
jgi:L-fucose isomerase-like protein